MVYLAVCVVMIKPYKIEQGFFAGCTIYEDGELPPDVIEWHSLDGRQNWRGDVRTGEVWVLPESKSSTCV